MKRAAIAIGVDRAGDLPALSDAAAGARRFAKWARCQGIYCSDEMVLTDENNGRVIVGPIKKAIKKLVENTEQLFIYFAGHGVNIGFNEYWLLSDAPSDPQAAVNVRGSEDLARYSGISHVLFISDACRTAAEGIRAQRVSGSEIFPNEDGADLEKPVDQFFACTLGRPALEIRDPNTTAREYSALYTTALLDGLCGREPSLLEWADTDQGRTAIVRPRPLKTYLSTVVPQRLRHRNLQTKVIQVPDAHIESDSTAWIAELTEAKALSAAPQHSTLLSFSEPPLTGAILSSKLLQAALAERALGPILKKARMSAIPNAAAIAKTIDQIGMPFTSGYFETGCGFKVRGAKFVEAFSIHAHTRLFSVPGEAANVDLTGRSASSVLLVLESGNGVVLPAISRFVTALTIEDGELIDVALESIDFPTDDQSRALHTVAAASTRDGVFRLEGPDASNVANSFKNAKRIDPTLAIYAAYAYNDLSRRDLIRETSECVRNQLAGAQFFDIALLAGDLDGREIEREHSLLSFIPLLAQGWALLAARRVKLPASLDGVRNTVLPSVWTMVNEAGVKQIRLALTKGDVR
jgi:hypothetical protein